MTALRLGRVRATLLFAVSLPCIIDVAGSATAQNCNLAVPPCSVDCAGGCAGSFPVSHLELAPCDVPTFNAGSFDLTGTVYEDTCREGAVMPCPGGTLLPPMRFWSYDNYADANSGCVNQIASRWLVHAHFDLWAASPQGLWTLDFATWSGPTVPGPDRLDGCFNNLAPAVRSPLDRTALDIRGLENDGLTDHDSWYLATAARQTGTTFDFDWLTGGDIDRFAQACAPRSIAPRPVPQPVVAGLDPITCLDPLIPAQGQAGPAGYFNVTVVLEPTPPYYTEVGRFDPEAPLIEGYQLAF